MTGVSHTVFDALEDQSCYECKEGTLERKLIDGDRVLVCDSCGQTRAILWGGA